LSSAGRPDSQVLFAVPRPDAYQTARWKVPLTPSVPGRRGAAGGNREEKGPRGSGDVEWDLNTIQLTFSVFTAGLKCPDWSLEARGLRPQRAEPPESACGGGGGGSHHCISREDLWTLVTGTSRWGFPAKLGLQCSSWEVRVRNPWPKGPA
jgi:hypothetical protein